MNTGFLIGGEFFHPGDALDVVPKNVRVLALPVAGPWLKISEPIDYALKMKPAVCFPIHDGGLKYSGLSQALPKEILEANGIKFENFEGQAPKVF